MTTDRAYVLEAARRIVALDEMRDGPVRCAIVDAALVARALLRIERENEDLKAFIRGIGINCQRATETLSQVSASAAALSPSPQADK